MPKLIVKAYSISGRQLVEKAKSAGVPKPPTAPVPKVNSVAEAMAAPSKSPALAPSGFSYGSGGFKQPTSTVVKPPDTSKYSAVGGKPFDPNPIIGAHKVKRGREQAKLSWKHKKEKLMSSIQDAAQSRSGKKVLMDQRRIAFNNALIAETT